MNEKYRLTLTPPRDHYHALVASIEKLVATAWSGSAYRSASPLAANNEPVEAREFIGITKLQLANLRVIRADSNLSEYPGNRIRLTLQEKLDPTIVQVAHVSVKSFGLRMAHHKVAKTNTLHST
jgi:hypothetical protein